MREAVGQSVFPKLKEGKKTLQTLVYEHIREQIMRGSLKWGERLSEESLAHSFNVSRTPIREAIFRLEQDGLVIKKPHNGFCVREFTEEEINEICRVRAVLEPLLVGLVIENMNGELKSKLENNIRKSKECLRNREFELLIYQITEFHEILYDYSGSPKLCAFLSSLGGESLMNRCMAVKTEGVYEDFVAQHTALAEALFSRNKPLAKKIMKAHLQEGKRCALKILEKEKRGLEEYGFGPGREKISSADAHDKRLYLSRE
jgi:DNA-binding GntR family transcriptional regulator